jgi:hypothetical protein
VTIWAAIFCYSAGHMINLNDRIAACDYVDVSRNLVHPVSRYCFLTMMQFFKMTVHPYTHPEVFSLGVRSVKMHFNIFPGQHNRQTEISSNHYGQC